MINVNPHNPAVPSARPSSDRAPNEAEPLLLPSSSAVFDLARRDPSLRADVFQSDWSAIDRDRTRAARAGLADRITFHHKLAFFCPLVRAALARARIVLIDDP
ncbi:MAG: hypothetical protein IT436_10560 [Phycisphaerales bacterium]|nr:hypothetical protein [Phycisphaerales bacterium]